MCFVTHSAEEPPSWAPGSWCSPNGRAASPSTSPSPIPRTGLSAEELRDSPEYTVLRTQVHEAIKGAAE